MSKTEVYVSTLTLKISVNIGVYKSQTPGRHGDEFRTVAPNTCGASVRNSIRVFLIVASILRWVFSTPKSVHPCVRIYTAVGESPGELGQYNDCSSLCDVNTA